MITNSKPLSSRFSNIADWLNWWLSHPVLSEATQKTFNKYYFSFKSNFSRYIQDHYQSQIAEAMACVKPGAKVLEVGCGCGTESLWFALNGASVVGMDLETNRLAVAKERRDYINQHIQPIDAEFVEQNIFNVAPSGDFDMIWMEQAFHHIEPREQLPAQLSALLKPGGSIVISEANAYNPLMQLQLFKIRGFKTIVEYTDTHGTKHVYGNERISTAHRISKLFAKAGFETTCVKHFRVLPNFKGVQYVAWIDKLIPHWLLPMYSHFNIVLKKPL